MRATDSLIPFALSALLLGACSGNKPPEPLPSQTTTEVTPTLEPPPPLPPPVREMQPSRGGEVKVIDPGEPDDKPKTLLEASRVARDQKNRERTASIVITDENLHEYTEGVQLMKMETGPAAPPPAEQAAAAAAEAAASGSRTPTFDSGSEEDVLNRPTPEKRDETYWRTRALELRMGWRRAQDQIEDLELEAAALRQEFYAQDDNYVRDSRIKPEWDRVLDRIHLLEDRKARFEKEIDVFVAQGQSAGVPQGWLNIGWELGPTADKGAASGAATDETLGGFKVHQSKNPNPATPPPGGGR